MNTERQPYKPFEARLIQLLRLRFEKSALEFDDHLKVGDLPLEIDAVVRSPRPDWQPDFSKFPRLFEYFRQYNVMEIKTEQDRFELEDLPKLLAYGWLYMGRAGLTKVREVTVTALVHHLTPKLRAILPDFGFVEVTPDIYRRDSDMVAYVIAFANLPDERLPEELQAFADPARRRKVFLSSIGDQEKVSLIETIFDLYESEVRNYMLNIREESLRNILSVVGEEKIFSALGNEKVIKALLRNEQLLKLLLAELEAGKLRERREEENRH